MSIRDRISLILLSVGGLALTAGGFLIGPIHGLIIGGTFVAAMGLLLGAAGNAA